MKTKVSGYGTVLGTCLPPPDLLLHEKHSIFCHIIGVRMAY
jgi:hypothetical protein